MCKEKYPKNVNWGGLDKNYSELEAKINDNSFHHQNYSLLKTINQNYSLNGGWCELNKNAPSVMATKIAINQG